jgi:hypothetical protein
MTAPVVCYYTISLVCQEEHLSLPVVGAEWPSMTERNGGLCSFVSPVHLVDFSAVFGGDVGHDGVFEL